MQRIILYSIICFFLFSCNKKNVNSELLGLWIAIPNNSIGNIGVIHFDKDSVVLYPYDGIQLKAAYEIQNEKLLFSNLTWFHVNEAYADSSSIYFKIKNDTLIWNNDWGLVKSPFNSYTEYYANSKGLRINLPESNFYTPSDYNKLEFVDFFIGYDQHNKIGISINNESTEFFDTYQRIKQLQDTTYLKRIVFRIFADKSVDATYIHDIHTTMKRMGIDLIQYVTTNSNRHPYGYDHSGIKLLIRDLNIRVIKDI